MSYVDPFWICPGCSAKVPLSSGCAACGILLGLGPGGPWTYTREEREASEPSQEPSGEGGPPPAAAETGKTASGPAQSATLQASLVRPNRAEHLPGIFRQAAELQLLDGGGLHAVVQVVAGLAARVQELETSVAALATTWEELHPDMALASERSRSANTGLSVLAKRVQALEQAPGAPSQVEELGAQVTKLQLVLSTLIVRLKKHAVLADILRDLKLE